MLSPALKRSLPVALAVTLVAAGCTGSDPAPLESLPSDSDTQPTAEAAPPMPVGPLEFDAATYWTLGATEGDISYVNVGGCQPDAPCPSFAVITGETAQGIDTTTPFFDDGVDCPVPDSEPADGTLLSEHPATVAGHEGVMSMFEITCAGADGEPEVTLPQNQWSVVVGDDTIVVVDRWAFDGMSKRVAEASLT